MAFFGVTVATIKTSRVHPDADRLSICEIEGSSFQFVTGKNEYKPGDKVLYFPIDSVMPEELQAKMGLTGKLAGKEFNRIRTARLRGAISQGIVGRLDLLDEYNVDENSTSEEITQALSIIKYEKPPRLEKAGVLLSLPCGMSEYDIEGADKFSNVFNKLMDQKVCITEKMEGENFSATISVSDGKFFVNKRNNTIIPIEGMEHVFWAVAKKYKLEESLRELLDYIEATEFITVYGELVGAGIPGNIYKFKEQRLYIYDLLVDGKFIDATDFLMHASMHFDAPIVPVLEDKIVLSEWLNGRTIQEASTGNSVFGDFLREGVVIKPLVEQHDSDLGGRLILKQRSPEYLIKTGM